MDLLVLRLGFLRSDDNPGEPVGAPMGGGGKNIKTTIFPKTVA